MSFFYEFPKRQEIYLAITVTVGLLLVLVSQTSWLESGYLNRAINFYGFAVPLFLLISPLVIDLDDSRIFFVWGVIGVVFLLIYFLLRDDPDFVMRSHINDSAFTRRWLANSSVSALRSLPLFLVCYKILNREVKKASNRNIINTFRQLSWYNGGAGRRMNWLDVVCNVVLYFAIIVGALIKFW